MEATDHRESRPPRAPRSASSIPHPVAVSALALAAALPTLGAAGADGESTNPVVLVVSLAIATYLFVGIPVGIVVAVVTVVRRRRRSRLSPREALLTSPTAELERQAGVALAAADDAVRAARREAADTERTLGADAIAPLTSGLDAAEAELATAFEARRLLDAEPPDEARRRTVLTEIAQHCAAIPTALHAASAALADVRDVYTRSPAALADIAQATAAAQTRLPGARLTVDHLTTAYPNVNLVAVASHPDRVAALLSAAGEDAARAAAALTVRDTATAVAAVQAAQAGVRTAVLLLDAVESTDRELVETLVGIEDRVASLQADLADDARLRSRHPEMAQDAQLTAAVAEARIAASAVAAARAGDTDPATTLTRLVTAEAGLDAALAPYRTGDEQSRRSRELLDTVVARAEAAIRSAHLLLDTRPTGVGSGPRGRLVEAEALVGEARSLVTTKPATALRRAQKAVEAADDALRAIERAVAGAGRPAPPPPVPEPRRAARGSSFSWSSSSSVDDAADERRERERERREIDRDRRDRDRDRREREQARRDEDRERREREEQRRRADREREQDRRDRDRQESERRRTEQERREREQARREGKRPPSGQSTVKRKIR